MTKSGRKTYRATTLTVQSWSGLRIVLKSFSGLGITRLGIFFYWILFVKDWRCGSNATAIGLPPTPLTTRSRISMSTSQKQVQQSWTLCPPCFLLNSEKLTHSYGLSAVASWNAERLINYTCWPLWPIPTIMR